jgi:hypothetical protein
MIINQKITDDIKSAFQEALEIEDKYEKESLKKWKKLEKFTSGIKRK